MKRSIAIAVAALGVTALAPSAASAATFEGRCTIPGTASFNGPVATIPAARTFTMTSDPGASCDGTLDGVAVSGKRVVLFGQASGTFTCAAALAQGGAGSLRFPNATADPSDDPVVNFTNLTVTSHTGLFEFTADGASGGKSFGAGELLSNASPAVIQACATGTGIRTVKFGAQIVAGPGFSG
jgi:hypothetical protein